MIGFDDEFDYSVAMRWIVAAFVLLSPSAFAEEEARLIAFSEGRYAEAVDLVALEQSADAQAFAARSLLADAMSNDEFSPPLAALESAEGYARAALAIDPEHVEGRLQLAIALSLRSRPLSIKEVRQTNLAEESKHLVRSVLEDDPANPYAHGFMAVWNIEVRRRGGAIGAAVLGASVRKARRHYEAAIDSRPQDASIHWQYARALAALDAEKYHQEIETALQSALNCGTESQLETAMQARAAVLHQAVQTESADTVQDLAARML